MRKFALSSTKRRSRFVREIVETLAIAILIVVTIHFTLISFQVNDSSMNNTLQKGQYVLVNKTAYLFRQPERGDIIVYAYTGTNGTTVDTIKRIIGLPGDMITYDSMNIWVNGVQLKEPYITQKINYWANSFKVPANNYFVVGDNRPDSTDSRAPNYTTALGTIPKDNIVGKAILVYWPFKQWKFLDSFPSVFAQIK